MPVTSRQLEQEGTRSARLILVIAALSITPIFLTARPAFAASPSEIQARMAGETGRGWAVRRAQLEETLTGTTITLKIQNEPGVPRAKAAFYAEYFDQAGARRFTAVFSADHNYEHRTGDFQSGETRTLWTTTAYLYPAVVPVSAKVWAISSRALQQNEPSSPKKFPIPIQVPAVLRQSPRAGDREGRVWLGDDALKEVHGPVADILLARALVNLDGSISNAQVVQAIDQGVGRWFQNFVRQRRFKPARANSERRASQVLILVRSIVSLRCLQQNFIPPSASPVVKRYVKSLDGKHVPVLTVVLLTPSSPDYASRAMPHPAHFRDDGFGAEWTKAHEESPPTAASAPGPELRRFTAPPGSTGCP